MKTWSIRSYRKFTEFYFGTTSKEVDPEKYFGSGEYLSYCVDNQGRNYFKNSPRGPTESLEMQNDDLVTITLDLLSKVWFVSVNDGENQQLLEIEASDEVNYKFVLQTISTGNSVTLADFEILHSNQ